MIEQKEVKSIANCAACHKDANEELIEKKYSYSKFWQK